MSSKPSQSAAIQDLSICLDGALVIIENQVTVEDLALHKEWVSCLGFVLAANSWFSTHKGRDITTRVG